MTAESSEPEEVGQEKPDESVVLNLDDFAAELEDVEVDEAEAAEAGRKLAETLHRVTSPPWLESTQRLSKLLEGAVRPQMLQSTQRIRDIVAGPQSPAMSVVKSITESMALREDLIKPRFMLSDAIAKSTAERAAFSVASGLKISDSVTSMLSKLVADTGGVGLAGRSDMMGALGLAASRAVSDSVARFGMSATGQSAASLGLTASSSIGQTLAGLAATSDSVRRITEGVFANDIGRARSIATMQLAATSGITDLIAGDKMMASWRQSLLSEATARSLVGTIKLPDGNADLLRDIVGINAATARVVSLYADQNKYRMLAPAISARPTRELRGYLAGMPLAPDVDDLTLAIRASRGVAGIAAVDLLASPGMIDPEAGELLEEEVVEPWVSGLAASWKLLLDRLGWLDGTVPDLLREAWHQVERDGPSAVSMAAHAVVEVIDRTLRAVAPEQAVLEAHASGRLNSDAVYDKNGKLAPTRAGRIAYALLERRTEEARLVAAQTKALVKSVTFVHEDLQAGKHASEGTVGLIRTYLVSVEATLTQLLYEPGD